MDSCYQANYDKYDWLIFYEIDEFLYLKEYNNIKTYLANKKFDKCESIQLNWVHMSDNNYLFYEDKPLHIRFTEIGKNVNKKKYNRICFVKTIIKGHLKNINITHNHLLNKNLTACDGFGKKSKVNKIESLITDKTVAILPVHVYGHICNVEKIDEIAKKYNLKVIYDAAHVFGVKYKGKSIGNYGDISMFSFHATKVFNTIEGGSLVYNDSSLKEKIEKLKNFGINGPEKVEYVGINAKMNEFCAAMGLCNLRHIDEEIAKREKVYNRYLERLSNVDGIEVSKIQDNVCFPVIS